MIHTKNAHINPKCRSDFILWVGTNTSRKDISRHINDGTVEVLGGFDRIHPSHHPGWMLRVLSKNKTEYNVAITMDEKKRWLNVWVASKIPWDAYNGKIDRGFWCLYDGDNPKHYLLQKVRAIREKRRKETITT